MSTGAFFAIPKQLETDPKYASLSVEARYLYGKMRDRFRLSIKNNWHGPSGFFINMSRESIGACLNRSLPTVRKIIKQLVDAGLIIDEQVGLTHCNRIYVQLLDGEDISDFQPAEKRGFTPDRNSTPTNKNDPSNTDSRGYVQRPYDPNLYTKYGQKKVLAQQYTQREYTKEELNALIEII